MMVVAKVCRKGDLGTWSSVVWSSTCARQVLKSRCATLHLKLTIQCTLKIEEERFHVKYSYANKNKCPPQRPARVSGIRQQEIHVLKYSSIPEVEHFSASRPKRELWDMRDRILPHRAVTNMSRFPELLLRWNPGTAEWQWILRA